MIAVVVWVLVLDGVAADAASATWTVTNPNSDGSFTVEVEPMVLTNTSTGDVVSCPTPTESHGTLRSGTYSDPQFEFVEIGELWAEYSCTDVRGGPVTVHQLPWRFQAETYDVDAGRTAGFVYSHIFTPFVVERPGCTYGISEWVSPGTTFMDFTYTNAPSTLTVSGPALSVFGPPSGDGCAGIAHDGDMAMFSATYRMTPGVTIVARRPATTQVG